MIGHYPCAYPDELLYSLCARYSERMQYNGISSINAELFGSSSISASIDLPRHLSYLDACLPHGHLFTADAIINKHTLFPFYRPFLSSERVARIHEAMKGSDDAYVYLHTGINRSTIRPPDWIRFCPLCAEEDKRHFGEAYWHRLHQVPGVEACTIHNIFLENSIVRARNRLRRGEYISAEHALVPTPSRSLNKSDTNHRILIALAHDVAWLMNQRDLVPGLKVLHDGYIQILDQHDILSTSGTIRIEELLNRFRSKYSSILLNKLQCSLDERKEHAWPVKFRYSLNSGHFVHPIKHLLLIQLLDHTAESFFKTCAIEKSIGSTRAESFGKGPWPCLNLVCKYLKKVRIKTSHVTPHPTRKGVMVGRFTCACGFSYHRCGPDKSEADLFRFDRIDCYGPVWEEALKEMWQDLSLSIKEMAPQLGISRETVPRRAARIGLTFPRKGPGTKAVRIRSLQKRIIKKLRRNQSGSEKRLQPNRESWLSNLKEFPVATRTQLKKKSPKIYHWLYYHDYDWLKAHMPPVLKLTRSRSKTDWHSRDIQLEKEVRCSAIRLKNIDGRPTRVSVSAIGRDIDKLGSLMGRKVINKLPLTAKTMSEVVETNLEFAIRRIEFATHLFNQENIRPNFTVFSRRAGIGQETRVIPKIKTAIETALLSLK